MVAIPAVIQAGSETKLCASLLQPKETLVMTISLIGDEQSKILLQESSDQEFHRCFQFQVSQHWSTSRTIPIRVHSTSQLCDASLHFSAMLSYLMGNINVVAYQNFSGIQAKILHKKDDINY